MRSEPKTLVVGTTPDYVEFLRRSCGGSAVFITEPGLRAKASEPCPEDWEELLTGLEDFDLALSRLFLHLKRHGLALGGVAAFDCESLPAAAFMAERLGLPFASRRAVENCRDKFLSKKLWRAAGLKAPDAQIVDSLDDALSFFRRTGGACVVKPRAGTGGEFVFLCSGEAELESACSAIFEGLDARERPCPRIGDGGGRIVIEEYVDATEYSADFMVDGDEIGIIRLSRKIKRVGTPIGVTIAYLLLEAPPDGVDELRLRRIFLDSCRALGVGRAICMMDFFVKGGEVLLLETAPRPGGDCIPFLLEKAAGIDILKMTLDFSCGSKAGFENLSRKGDHLGMRIMADREGVLEAVDVSALSGEKNVKSVHVGRRAGSEILLPPKDYDSWVLGHVIAGREKSMPPERQVEETLSKIDCRIAGK